MSLSLVNRAIRERWPITTIQRAKVLEVLDQHLNDQTITNDKKLGAIKLLAALDALNLKQTELEIRARPQTHLHANMSTDELMALIRERMQALGLPLEQLNGFLPQETPTSAAPNDSRLG